MSAQPRELCARLRPMREGDLKQVLAVEQAAYPYPWTRGIFEDCLRVGYSCWVLEEGAQIVGYGVMTVAAGESHILNVCVRPERQRAGYGLRLLEHLVALSRRHHADTALLEVRPSNRAALALYRKAGFNEVGVRRGYYPGTNGREDALILALHLGTGPW
jgi:ribosomal-protein-alanine N-acetyltransferase